MRGGGGGGGLESLRNEYANKLSDYTYFKEQNRLNREPYYPSSKLRHCLLACVAVIVETLFNGNFLGIGAQGGRIEGYTLALIISIINVGGAFGGGNAARFLNDRSVIRTGLGLLCVLLCIVVLILFNLLVAHYRESLLASLASGEYVEALEAGKQAWESFSNNWFGVTDFMSWLLFGMGMISAGLGAWKGYFLEDPYPGYSRRARALKDARDKLQEEEGDAIDDIAQIREESVKNIDHYVNQFRNSLMRSRDMRTNLLELPRNFQREREKLRSQIKLLHAKYCPDEEDITLGEPLPEQKPLLMENIDLASVEECAREHRQKLIDRCNTAMSGLKATVGPLRK